MLIRLSNMCYIYETQRAVFNKLVVEKVSTNGSCIGQLVTSIARIRRRAPDITESEGMVNKILTSCLL